MVAAGATAVVAAASPSLAGTTATATGSFYYQDLLGGAGQLNNPTLGVCYKLPTAELSGYNDTNVNATVYLDGSCTAGGVATSPHSQVNGILFESVLFTAVH
ncbi:hypothetical protein [Streptomyces sp. WELS2]|uniref:hypothetical protein n=1 Tax=Streptomyces sp. WELS2 TaxID=2749435 RepID=UPI0015F06398|nr:hypothetical protein [Streptomyces sp. WELS2]